jgi:hypothetical protein
MFAEVSIFAVGMCYVIASKPQTNCQEIYQHSIIYIYIIIYQAQAEIYFELTRTKDCPLLCAVYATYFVLGHAYVSFAIRVICANTGETIVYDASQLNVL